MKVRVEQSFLILHVTVSEWNILEQVCLAAIDTSQLELVDYCIKELHNQFQNSLRVRRLKAMKLEAMER